MNDLEIALLDVTNNALNTYLEIEPTAEIRKHIEEIKVKSLKSPKVWVIKQKLQELIDSI